MNTAKRDLRWFLVEQGLGANYGGKMSRNNETINADLKGEAIDIESIRRETAIILDKRVKKALKTYAKRTILGDISYSIDTDDKSIYTMYASYYFFENPIAIKDLEIVVHRQQWNDPYLEISLCHELGHLENALQSRDKNFLDPKNILQELYIEIMADRRAAKIYDDKEGNKAVGQWLKYCMKNCIIPNFPHKNIHYT